MDNYRKIQGNNYSGYNHKLDFIILVFGIITYFAGLIIIIIDLPEQTPSFNQFIKLAGIILLVYSILCAAYLGKVRRKKSRI